MKLRPIRRYELETLFKYRNNPDIYKWCRQYEPLTWENHVKWFESLPNRTDVKMYAIDVHTQVVGVCGLTDIDYINRRAEFSLYIGSQFHGKGYGKEALKLLLDKGFYDLNLHLIWGETFDGNPAAKTFTALGMAYEGRRQDFYYRRGKYIDAHLYSITRRQYESTLSHRTTSNCPAIGFDCADISFTEGARDNAP